MIWLDKLAKAAEKHNLRIHAYCLMPNHYHLLVETPLANLPDGMHTVNADYCQHFNNRHGLTGHVIQGRFHAGMVEKNSQLLAVARYISLNPVRAKLVADAADWQWSSHRHYLEPEFAPDWLETEWLLSHFGNGSLEEKVAAYRKFVNAGVGMPDPLALHKEWPDAKREQAQSLYTYSTNYADRNEAMSRAYQTNTYTRQEIADHFGVSIKTVSRAIRDFPDENA